MRYIWQHAQNIIEQYDGSMPLSHFLTNYFKKHPKLGSRDRKLLSEMVYCWYRCSRGIINPASGNISFEDEVTACLVLCGTQQKIISDFLEEEWNFDVNNTTKQRLKILEEKNIFFDANKLFYQTLELSAGIEKNDWLFSMLQKPRLFIRIRKNKERTISLLHENEIAFEQVNENCFSLAVGAAIDKFLPQDAYVVQDASSQQTGTYFRPGKNEAWYDCCSGAGGKSLLLKDIEPSVQLTISDTRESIIQNLKNRFTLYQLALPAIYNVDVSDKEKLRQKLNSKQFDGIICDVPCSGSGTWARTPEQLYFFNKNTLTELSELQKNIAINVSGHLKPGGKLIYITCSVFKDENENVVDQVIKNTGLHVEEMKLINGVVEKADSMFIAVLKSKL